jgi:RNA polymerase sigma-70 factor (ECF subfamily)
MSSNQNQFEDLIRRVRAGEAAAAAELVRKYEPAIRLAVRVHLTDRRLRRLLDSLDICQSVLATFFVRAAAGQFDIDQPQRLLNLLVTIARNKLSRHARHQRAGRRDQRRLRTDPIEQLDLPARESAPEQVCAHRELLHEVRRRLSPEERQLADQRAGGLSWSEIATAWGASPDSLRMRLTRALDRVAEELHLDE